MNYTKRLKEPGICRLFISSPFRGFEDERTELMSKYIPQLKHLCSEVGVQLVTVDLRWGITAAAASNAQTINICLREIDRTDIFVGLYGQRYGWHGKDDKDLQKNFDNAMGVYPWLAKYRDCSVTDLEFRHGHLNSPGTVPSVFCFRDKKYDDELKKSLLKSGDKERALAYETESDVASKKLALLQKQVLDTKLKCLAVNINYKDPQTGAKQAFDAVKHHLATHLLKGREVLSQREAMLAVHAAIASNRRANFTGGKAALQTLNTALEKCSNERVLIVGAPGSGKTALTSHWIHSLKSLGVPVISHFIGCAEGTADVMNTIARLQVEFDVALDPSKKLVERTMDVDEMNLEDEIQHELGQMVQKLSLTMDKLAAKKPKVVLLLEGLERMDKGSKTAQCLYWLPCKFPRNMMVVTTARDDEDDIIREMKDKRGFSLIRMEPLSVSDRQDLCKAVLTRHGKELSPASLEKIVKADQSSHPLYLRTVISELCVFGSFRELGDKITSLVKCQNVQCLFSEMLRRLETDYDASVVQQVMCALTVAVDGLAEQEIMEIFDLNSPTWSPLYFAVKDYTVDTSGVIQLGFDDLKVAVATRYMTDDGVRKKMIQKLIDYFFGLLKDNDLSVKVMEPQYKRPAEELPGLCRALGDKKQMIKILTSLPVFVRLFVEHEYELLDHWKWTECSGNEIAELLFKAIDSKMAAMLKAAENQKQKMGARLAIVSYLDALTHLCSLGHYCSALEMVLKKKQKVLDESKSVFDPAKLRAFEMRGKHKMGVLYNEMGRLEEAMKLQKEVVDYRQEIVQKKGKQATPAELKELALSYHTIGMLYNNLGHTDEAVKHFLRSLELQELLDNKLEVADSLHNLGVMFIKNNQFPEALKHCTRSLEIYQAEVFGHLPPVIGVMMSNIAVCYRNLGHLDKAEEFYKKSLEISDNSLGRDSTDSAFTLLNLGSMMVSKKEFQAAETMFREALEIYHKHSEESSKDNILQAKEKLIFVLLKLNKAEEALTLYANLFPTMLKRDGLSSCWPGCHETVARVLLNVKMFNLARQVIDALIKSRHRADTHYILLDTLDRLDPPKTARDKSLTIPAALKEWPGSLKLVKYWAETHAFPNGDADCLIAMIDGAAPHLPQQGGVTLPALCETIASWCQEQVKPDLALAVCMHGDKLFPGHPVFTRESIMMLRERERWEEAWKIANPISDKTDDVELLLTIGDVAMRTKHNEIANRCFQKVKSTCGANHVYGKQAEVMMGVIRMEEAAKQTPKKN